MQGLGASALAQIEKALAEDPLPEPRSRTTRRTAPQGESLVRCCTPDCTFEPTKSIAAMEAHADSEHHHRYSFDLETI